MTLFDRSLDDLTGFDAFFDFVWVDHAARPAPGIDGGFGGTPSWLSPDIFESGADGFTPRGPELVEADRPVLPDPFRDDWRPSDPFALDEHGRLFDERPEFR